MKPILAAVAVCGLLVSPALANPTIDAAIKTFDAVAAEGPDDMTSHIRSTLTHTSLTIPVISGRMALGTWQSVCLVDINREGLERRPAATGHDSGTGQDQPLGPGQAGPRRTGRRPRRPSGP